MPTIDPSRNVEYVKRSQAKKKETIGAVEYNKINAMPNNDTETN